MKDELKKCILVAMAFPTERVTPLFIRAFCSRFIQQTVNFTEFHQQLFALILIFHFAESFQQQQTWANAQHHYLRQQKLSKAARVSKEEETTYLVQQASSFCFSLIHSLKSKLQSWRANKTNLMVSSEESNKYDLAKTKNYQRYDDSNENKWSIISYHVTFHFDVWIRS